MPQISTADIRKLFDRQWIAVSVNGFSAIRPPSELQEDSDVLQGFADDDMELFRKVVRASECVIISYEDGRFSRLRFIIPGFSDQEMLFPPWDEPEKMSELKARLRYFDWTADIPEGMTAEDYIINAVFADDDPIGLRGSIKWPGFLDAVKRFDALLPGYSCEAFKPDHTGVGYAKFTAPMLDDETGFSVKLKGELKEAFSELLECSTYLELDFSCFRDYAALDMYFTA